MTVDASVRSERQILTYWQEKALERIAEEGRDAVVVGWDAGVQGPLIELAGLGFMAITPRGREISRPQEEK